MKLACRLVEDHSKVETSARPMAGLRVFRWRRGRGYIREQRGAAAVEFAILLPVLAFMTLGAIELGLAMLAQHIMESATFSASRLGKTGYAANGQFEDLVARQAAMRAAINKRAGTLLDVQKVTITTKSYSQFSQIGQPEPFMDANGNGKRDNGENFTDINGNGVYDTDMGASGLGGAKEVVVYTVTYPWTITTPFIGKVLGDDGTLNLTARAVVLNEPF